MSQGSHTREEVRKELLPQFSGLVDTVFRARQKDSFLEAEDNIAKAGDVLRATAIGQWLLLFHRKDDGKNNDSMDVRVCRSRWNCEINKKAAFATWFQGTNTSETPGLTSRPRDTRRRATKATR